MDSLKGFINMFLFHVVLYVQLYPASSCLTLCFLKLRLHTVPFFTHSTIFYFMFHSILNTTLITSEICSVPHILTAFCFIYPTISICILFQISFCFLILKMYNLLLSPYHVSCLIIKSNTFHYILHYNLFNVLSHLICSLQHVFWHCKL